MYKILICDDQPDIVNALKIYLAPEGYELFEAKNGAQAVEIVKEKGIHLVLLPGVSANLLAGFQQGIGGFFHLFDSGQICPILQCDFLLIK